MGLRRTAAQRYLRRFKMLASGGKNEVRVLAPVLVGKAGPANFADVLLQKLR